MIDTRFSRCVRGFLYLLKESNPDLNVRLGPKYVSRLLSIDEKSASYYLCSIRKIVDFDQLIKSDSVVSFNPEEFTDCTYTEGLYIPAKLVKEKKCCYCGCSTRSMFEEHCYNVCQKCMHSHGSIKFLEGIIPRLYGNSKQSARSRSLSHSLTKEYISNLLTSDTKNEINSSSDLHFGSLRFSDFVYIFGSVYSIFLFYFICELVILISL